MPKHEKEESATSSGAEDTKLFLSPIASPLVSSKLQKRIYKLIKKASKAGCIRRGVKETCKSIRKGEKGLCILAGDVSPIDVISHLPVLCEEQEIPYGFTPSKFELGAACNTKRPTSVVHIVLKDGFAEKEAFAKIEKELKKIRPTVF